MSQVLRIICQESAKPLAAARLLLPPWTTLSVRVLAVDERGAKAAIYGLNRVSRSTHELLLASTSREQEEHVLSKPREALQQAQGGTPRSNDPRLSVPGNRVRQRVVGLLDELERLEHWLLHRGRAELTPSDRGDRVCEDALRLRGETRGR